MLPIRALALNECEIRQSVLADSFLGKRMDYQKHGLALALFMMLSPVLQVVYRVVQFPLGSRR